MTRDIQWEGVEIHTADEEDAMESMLTWVCGEIAVWIRHVYDESMRVSPVAPGGSV